MPGQDKTGPFGKGLLTGRGLGLCNDDPAFGRGQGTRRGLGIACRRGFGRATGARMVFSSAGLTKEEEKKLLQDELKGIENEKQEIESKLKELE